MHPEELFTQALGLKDPWTVIDLRFDEAAGTIRFTVEAAAGARLACPKCQQPATVYDHRERTWRHLDFFQFEAYIHASVPRVKCTGCDKITQVQVPWARPNSGYTLLFEALGLTLAREMPVQRVARHLRVGDAPLWRLLCHHIDAARAKEDFSSVRAIGVDETAAKRGQNYISCFFDLGDNRLLFATEGRKKETFTEFVKDLSAHGGAPEQIMRDLLSI